MNTILITVFLAVLIFCAGGSLRFSLVLELMIGSMAVLAAGFSLLEIVKVNNLQCRSLVYLLTGVFISSLLVYFMSAWLNIPAGRSFVYFSAGIFLYVFTYHPKSFIKNVISDDQRIDLLVLAGLTGFTLLWCWQVSMSYPSLMSKGVLSAWIDYYYHGAQIAQFSDMKAIGQGDIFLAGESPFSYHRAIYMLPAAIAQAANLSGLAAATALLLPIGFLLLAIAIYCLGTQLAGRMAGVLAVICLLVLPDNSWLGLHNGFLGFRYIIRVAPGTSYGLAGCLVSFLFFAQWLRDKSVKTIFLSLLFAGSVYFFRAHFFVFYFPVLITSLFIAVNSEKKYFWQVMGLLFACVLIITYFYAVTHSAVIPFLKLVHLERGVNYYTDFYKHINELNQPILMILTGVILLVAGIAGVWTIIYPLLLWMKIRQSGWELIDYVPFVLLLCYVGIVLFAPAIYQTPDELQHRPSGLLYAIVIIFSIYYLTKISDKHNLKILFNYAQPVFVTGVIIGIILTGFYSDNYPLRVLFRGFSLYQDYQVPHDRDIIQAAMFLRHKAVTGEIFLTSKDDTDPMNVDSAVVISSISGMPGYLGEQRVQSLRAELSRLSVIQYRNSVVRQSIIDAPTREQAMNIMHVNHISWYIALSSPKWDKTGKESDFKSNSVALYHV